jgi:succinate-semialdehyde dehydrogenase / glutarate-semialdehyde dehydrogenase
MTATVDAERDLLRDTPTQLWIDGKWRGGGRGTFEVHDPSTGEVLTEVADADPADGDAALGAAADAQREWAATPPRDRGEILRSAFELITERKDDFALLMTLEMGKPLSESAAEVTYAAEFFRWFSEEACRIEGSYKVAPNGASRLLTMRQPVGPCLFITPWNFPLAMGTRKIGPAVAAGCTMVVKPAAETPLSMLALARVLDEAGLPPGVLNVVPTRQSGALMEPLIKDPRTRKLSFTGSTEVGRKLVEQSAQQLLRLSMELGGNAPFLVFADADLDLAVEKAAEARFWNCGQVCTCNERTYVHRSRYDEFVARFVERAKAVNLADPADASAQMGPKVSAAEWNKVADMVGRAEEQGAEIVLGGGRPDGDRFARGYWFSPTVLTGATNDMDVVQQEVFGPVLPIVPFDDYAQAIEYANSTAYGLTSYVFTRDIPTAMRATDDLEFGEVYVNKIGPEDVQGFHHGWKDSGLGGEDGEHGYQRYVQHKTLYLGYGTAS